MNGVACEISAGVVRYFHFCNFNFKKLFIYLSLYNLLIQSTSGKLEKVVELIKGGGSSL